MIATDLSGVFFGLKYELPAIVRSGGGSIVNMSSANGVVGVAGIGAFTAAKHGIVGLTRSAALKYAGKSVRVRGSCGRGALPTCSGAVARGNGGDRTGSSLRDPPVKR